MAFRYKGYAVLNIVFNLLYSVFNLLSLLIFIPFLQLIFRDPETPVTIVEPNWETMDIGAYGSALLESKMNGYLLANEPQNALLFFCLIALGLFFLKNLCRYLAMFFLAPIRNGIVCDLRSDLYGKIIRLPLGYYSDERKGDLISRFSNDVQEIEVSIMSSLELIFREPFMIVIALVTLFLMSWELTLFALLLLPIGALVIGRISKSLKRSASKGQGKLGEILSSLEETLTGLKIIKAFTAEGIVGGRFEKINKQYRRIMTKVYRKRDLASPLSEFLGVIVMIALVWFGGVLILDSMYGDGDAGMNGSEFIGFIIVFSQLLRPVQGIANAYANINKGLASVERINVILDAEDNIPEKEYARVVTEFNDAIAYSDVSFAYEKELVLNKISFTLKKGQTIALVGESGGGKSTIADLLPRFHDSISGGISIDGTNVKDLQLKALRGLMGIVSQRSILFNDTVHNNIAFSKPDASRQEVEEAAKIANAHAFIEGLENGYDTNIGDGGGKLSGGQQQRISIARAVLHNPPILILDEATSALDTESEKLVQDALFKLMENRTTLVIAHRLSTIQHADEILVIKEGEIAERGTHDNLLQQAGIYRKLFDLQSFG